MAASEFGDLSKLSTAYPQPNHSELSELFGTIPVLFRWAKAPNQRNHSEQNPFRDCSEIPMSLQRDSVSVFFCDMLSVTKVIHRPLPDCAVGSFHTTPPVLGMIQPMTKSTYGCHNRPPLRETALVQQGWARIGYHIEARHTVSIPDEMTKDCQYRKTELGKVDPKCGGCRAQ